MTGTISIGGYYFTGSVRFSLIADNHINRIVGSSSTNITDMGLEPLTISIDGETTSFSNFQNIRKTFLAQGEQELILDSGWKYLVYRSGFRPYRERGDITNSSNDTKTIHRFTVDCICREPYQFSVDQVTSTKTFINNPYTWIADNSSLPITTSGEVNAVPDISLTGNMGLVVIGSSYSGQGGPCGMAYDGSNVWSCDNSQNKYYKHNADMSINTSYNSLSTYPSGMAYRSSVTAMYSVDRDSHLFYRHNADMTLNTSWATPATDPSGLAWDGTYFWSCDDVTGNIYKHNTSFTVLNTYSAPASDPWGLTWDGHNLWSCDKVTGYAYCHNNDSTLSVLHSYTGASASSGMTFNGTYLWFCSESSNTYFKRKHAYVDGFQIYNTSDSSVICNVANEVLYGAVHRINANGTGSVDWDEDFSTGQWAIDATYTNQTWDYTNDEMDLGTSGYISWYFDTKYPITGIPILTAQIDTTAGTSQIQISINGSTWYTIDDSVIDDTLTEYELISTGNLDLKRYTAFYFRIYGGATTTQTIKSLDLHIDLVTIDAEHPEVNIDENNSITVMMENESALQGNVSLIYSHRRWPG